MFKSASISLLSDYFHNYEHPGTYQQFDHDTFHWLPDEITGINPSFYLKKDAVITEQDQMEYTSYFLKEWTGRKSVHWKIFSCLFIERLKRTSTRTLPMGITVTNTVRHNTTAGISKYRTIIRAKPDPSRRFRCLICNRGFQSHSFSAACSFRRLSVGFGTIAAVRTAAISHDHMTACGRSPTHDAVLSDQDRGRPRGPAPPTPPCVRVRTRRLGSVDRLRTDRGKSERAEVPIGQCDAKRRAAAKPPRIMR